MEELFLSLDISVFRKLTPLLNKIYVKGHLDLDYADFHLPSEWDETKIQTLISDIDLSIEEIANQKKEQLKPGKKNTGDKISEKKMIPGPEIEKSKLKTKPISFGEPFQKLQKDKFNTIRLGSDFQIGDIHPITLKDQGYLGKAKILKRKIYEYQFVPEKLLIFDTETNTIEEARAKMKHYYPEIHPHRMVSVLLLEWVK